MKVSLIVCALSTTIATTAVAEPLGAQGAMESYFAGEKRGGLTLGLMGAAGIGAGAVLATRDSDIAKGAGYVALGFGVVHAAAGVFVTVTSNARIDKFSEEISRDEAGFVEREAPRIVGVKKQFAALKIVEGVLIAGGVGTAIYGLVDDRDLLAGIAIGVASEAAATLVFDIIADRRADRYLRILRGLRLSAGANGERAAVLGARF